ncbi:MAG TPA: exodeoxyribonuclease V subunit alpha [Candidatus Binatia bacterium]|nr:exodeoxyribonuclease V subunit alpha [Candidatus Binatia bacterium]
MSGPDAAATLDRLDALCRLGVISELDVAFARFAGRLAHSGASEVALAACLASAALAEGCVCADLARVAGTRPFRPSDDAAPAPTAPDIATWRAALRASGVVASPGGAAPLVLDDRDRLYLHRYWTYEREIALDLRDRARAPVDAVDEALLRRGLDAIFGRHDARREGDGEPDWQRVAAATAVLRRLCVVSGGPGTGKTTTVVRILALLAEQALAGGARSRDVAALAPRVRLTAPTGKAAARLQEAVRQAKAELSRRVPASVLAAIPEEASTIHRLLDPRVGSVSFRHDRANPLAVDVLVVDEASMVDVALMAKLLRALPAAAKLVLVGDKDQLASVEAGAVLGDVCGPVPGFSPEFGETVARVTGEPVADAADRAGATASADEKPGAPATRSPLRDCVVALRRSHRFRGESGIGALASEVRAGRGEDALSLLESGRFADLSWRPLDRAAALRPALAEVVVDGYRELFELVRAGAPPAAVFAAFGRFRVLCAMRQGGAGVGAVNEAIAAILEAEGLIERTGDWYAGRPVMITRNDYRLRLFNGDVGVALVGADGRLRVHFEDADGGTHALPPVRLPAHETVFAMTIHKSQGSEFEHAVVVLPPEGARIVGRELLYTGITRARRSLAIWGRRDTFLEAVAQPLARASGLRDALWGAD